MKIEYKNNITTILVTRRHYFYKREIYYLRTKELHVILILIRLLIFKFKILWKVCVDIFTDYSIIFNKNKKEYSLFCFIKTVLQIASIRLHERYKQ